jgi:hypothetical protein
MNEYEHRPYCFLVSAVVHLIVLFLLGLVTIVSGSYGRGPSLLCTKGDFSAGAERVESLALSPIAESPRADEEPPNRIAKPKDPSLVDASLAANRIPEAADTTPELGVLRPLPAAANPKYAARPNDGEGPPGRGTAKDGAGGGDILGPPRRALRQSGSPQDAVDGLGGDIAKALEKNDILVVWLFDASLSMQADRKMAGQRMVDVFRQLDSRTQNADFQHHECLISFGQKWAAIQPPTREWQTVAKKVQNISADNSGIENTFTCLQQAVPRYRKRWSKELLFIVWTDESGDDADRLEETIRLCRKHHARVSVVGPTAFFGRQKGYQTFQAGRRSAMLEVDKGPEVGILQTVPIPFWFYTKETTAIPSGFGPYDLVRLSQATGGSFTLYDQVAGRSRYRSEDLAAYLPDYRDAAVLQADAEASPLRWAVVQACRAVAELSDMQPPNMNPNDIYWHPPAEYQRRLAEIVSADLRRIERAKPMIDKAISILSDPEIDRKYEYERGKSRRWLANYLLAKGRLLALSIRYREYELLAASILHGGELRPTTNFAQFQPSKRLRSGEWNERRAEDVERYLTQCVEEHRGTPWADAAIRELGMPFGLEIMQTEAKQTGIIHPRGQSAPPPRL